MFLISDFSFVFSFFIFSTQLSEPKATHHLPQASASSLLPSVSADHPLPPTPNHHSSSITKASSPCWKQIVKEAFRKDADSLHRHQEHKEPKEILCSGLPFYRGRLWIPAITKSHSLWPSKYRKPGLLALRPGLWVPLPTVPLWEVVIWGYHPWKQALPKPSMSKNMMLLYSGL